MRVSPLNLLVLAYTLEVEGRDKHAVLRHCGLSAAEVERDSGEWVPITTFERLVEAVMAVTGDPAFGLIAGKSLALARFTTMTPLALFAPTLRQLFADVNRFSSLLFEHPEYTLVERANTCYVAIQPLMSQGEAGRFRQDFVVTAVLQILRFAGLTDLGACSVDLSYEFEPELRSRYQDAFGPGLCTGQRACRVTFPVGMLDRALPGHDPVSYTAARARAEGALAAHDRQIDTAEKVRQHLLRAFPAQPGIRQAAQQLGLTERTLRRNLAALDTSFQALAQECQQLKARGLLAERQMSIKQIADELGFSSVTSFHRAFKRWTGTTPLLWRDEQFPS
jgi:AraC-like DNA-binding protein